MNADTPPPGSPEAVKLGCKCPRLDNGHGKGYMGIAGVYVYHSECPLHSRCIDDGFGNEWPLCYKLDCQLHVVRPGKVECQQCDNWTQQDERDRAKHRADIL
jgi:hypothetical protein